MSLAQTIVWIGEWRDPAVHRQSEWTSGDCEGTGGAGGRCEPSLGGFVYLVSSRFPVHLCGFCGCLPGKMPQAITRARRATMNGVGVATGTGSSHPLRLCVLMVDICDCVDSWMAGPRC